MNRKDLVPESSPQAAYGARLRGLRESRQWTQEELGDRMGYSSTHISSVETGRKLSTLRFSRSADRVLGTEHTADSFEREWREVRHGSLLEGSPEYIDCERRASEIRLFEIGIIPGLLQTPEYARELARSAVNRGAIGAEQAEERVSLVAERRAALERTPAPLISVVLDESCIRRPIGEPAVMAAQLAYLVEFAQRPHTVLQVAPFEMGVRRTLNLPLYILTMADRSLMSYAESALRGNVERDNGSVVPLLAAYHQLQAEALSQAASVAAIRQL
ncbi:helix-turn-helix domain-containing protein [Streptomyces profundus]|uniref:helix-turn-helix domain-containing protein n=1 Tax=Streptomyces profundus TaxID=2867410 RepID=UPI001D168201|nr:helix-turn-helix transcriptional regulator [Streptomyces sp. MA3_2.13]UED84169.1 helix-turn-helix transcriptional regulator [Streptomyces sp. MA3_2.13]